MAWLYGLGKVENKMDTWDRGGQQVTKHPSCTNYLFPSCPRRPRNAPVAGADSERTSVVQSRQVRSMDNRDRSWVASQDSVSSPHTVLRMIRDEPTGFRLEGFFAACSKSVRLPWLLELIILDVSHDQQFLYGVGIRVIPSEHQNMCTRGVGKFS